MKLSLSGGSLALLFAGFLFITIPGDAFPTGTYANGDSTVAVLLCYVSALCAVLAFLVFGLLALRRQAS
jgi:hypothetical protein